MNFEQWYKKYRESQGGNFNLEYEDVKNSWSACKDNILQFIGEHNNYCCNYVWEITEYIKTL